MNIAIVGSGLTGSLAAISLANEGCRVDLYERLTDQELINRDRTYAITQSSRKILEEVGLWSHIVGDLIPFQYLNVIDHELNKQVQFKINDLNKADRKYNSVGWIANHKKTMKKILEFISNIENINKIPTSVIPNTNIYELIIAADGSNSTIKNNLKVPTFSFNYDQICLTAKVLLRGVKSNESFEILNKEGPFAVLPIGNDLFQVICSQTRVKAKYNMSISKSLFLDYISTILPYGIEVDTIIDEIKSYPISFQLNYSFHSSKYIFLGESAHVIHPVGGQGLNLCWRDIQSLSKLVSSPFLTRFNFLLPFIYTISRLFDILSISILTDMLVRYSRSNSTIFYIPRLIVFILMKKSQMVRKLILNIMTNGI